jgi:hypothetical protein
MAKQLTKQFQKFTGRALGQILGRPVVKCEKCKRLAVKYKMGISDEYVHSEELGIYTIPGLGSGMKGQHRVACWVAQPGRVAQVRRMLAELPAGKTRVKFEGIQYTAESLERILSRP